MPVTNAPDGHTVLCERHSQDIQNKLIGQRWNESTMAGSWRMFIDPFCFPLGLDGLCQPSDFNSLGCRWTSAKLPEL